MIVPVVIIALIVLAVSILWVNAIDREEQRKNGAQLAPRAQLRRLRRNRADLRAALRRARR